MRLHLDTSFLVDWHRDESVIHQYRSEILAGDHIVSVDPVVEAEFFGSMRADRDAEIVFASALAQGSRLPFSSEAARLAATWLAPMDQKQRRARFADALIAAIASLDGATVLTNDTGMPMFGVPVLLYPR